MVAAVSDNGVRSQVDGERFMGRKIKGVVPHLNGNPEDESGSPQAEQVRGEEATSSETHGEGRTYTNREEEQAENTKEGEEGPGRGEESGEVERVGSREPVTEVRKEASGSAAESEKREGAQLNRLAPTSLRRQVDSTNGHNTPDEAGRRSITRGQGEPQEGEVKEGGKEGQSKRNSKASYVDPPRNSRTARWSDEGTERQPYQEANIWEKQAWEAAPPSYYNSNKSPNLGKWGGPYPNHEMDRVDSSFPEAGNPVNGSRPSEVIRETQLPPKITHQGSLYKDIMASIGLDSPNTSTESRRMEANRGEALGDTPIRNSASSLIALGQHVLNSKQERFWKGDNYPR